MLEGLATAVSRKKKKNMPEAEETTLSAGGEPGSEESREDMDFNSMELDDSTMVSW